MSDSGALRYHEITKHSQASIRYGSQRLDWSTKPEPFKHYLELDPIALPERAADTNHPATLSIAGKPGSPRALDAPELARLVTLAAGIRRVMLQPNAPPVYFRTYACAGALYPIELYLACGGIDGLDAGLYHYSPLEDALRMLRPGDPRPYVRRAAGGMESLGRAPVTVILSGIPWRTAWKYKQRGYRHLFWDSGMILANLLALSASGGHSSEVVLGFEDAELNLLLGVDGKTEMAVCMVPIGANSGGELVPAALESPDPINHPTAKLSHWERSYDEIVQAHRETSLDSLEEAQLWHREPYPWNPATPGFLSPDGIEKVIRRRGSKRVFEPSSIAIEELAGILDYATHRLDCDWEEQISQVGLIVHDVEDLDSGSYAYAGGFDLINKGNFRENAQQLCLKQSLGGDGAATVFLLADLDDVIHSLGKRGYRAAQLDAGIAAGRIYLGAYACGFGATGLTFFDDEVREFFRTKAEPMLVVAMGY